MNQRNNQQDRPPRGGGDYAAGGNPPAVNFERVEYNPKKKTLSSVVHVTRGTRPVATERVSFLVDDVPVDTVLTGTTGHAALLIEIELSLGEHMLAAEVGQLGLAVKQHFPVRSAGEPTVDSPSITVTHTAISKADAFDVVLSVKASKAGRPIPNAEVSFVGPDLDERAFANLNGEANKRITVPNPTKSLKVTYEVLVSLLDHEVTQTVVLQLERDKVKLPTQLTVMRPVETAPSTGVYKMRVLAEHEEGVAPGVTISVAGGNEIDTVVTDENGIADIDLECLPDQTFTNFQVDVAGIQDTHELTLLGRAFAKAHIAKRFIGGFLVFTVAALLAVVLWKFFGLTLEILKVARDTLQGNEFRDIVGAMPFLKFFIAFIGWSLVTLIALLFLFGSSLKVAWERAKWRFYFNRSGGVLKRDEKSAWGRIVDRVSSPKPQAPTIAAVPVAEAAASAAPAVATPVAPASAPVVAHPRTESPLSWNNLAQWGTILYIALSELFLEEHKKR